MSLDIKNINGDFDKQHSVQTNPDEEYIDLDEQDEGERYHFNRQRMPFPRKRSGCSLCHGVGCEWCGSKDYN